jgi:ribose transport system permease protein
MPNFNVIAGLKIVFRREDARLAGATLLRRYGAAIALLVLVCYVASQSPTFLSFSNFMNILSQWSPVGVMAVGMTYVILVGGFDLSAASGFALCAVVAAALGRAGFSPELSFSIAIGVGLAIGLINALLVCAVDINPFIATLGTGFMLSSVPFVVVENPFILVEQPGFDTLGTGSWFGIPYTAILLVSFLAVGQVVLSKTPYGQWIYAVGGNPEASRLFGIRVQLVRGSTYVLSGFCMGVAAVISTSQLSYSASEQDPALVFDIIVSVVVGGTSLAGGFGSMWRTMAGLAILATLQNGLNLLQVNTYPQYIVKGCIIIMALSFDALASWFAVNERPIKRRRSAALTARMAK